ncbi:MAG: phenylphosphate carboxylase subunit beta [Anaerolineae bacterium]|nr:phenylphosphate carboxylase subunit beta [Anaerolineae bacterium]NIN97789.1 phenylphosphate carboxylase subunit beta [Anaerolineae bacterium]NIQ80785.1 phenylphosphate carboxylase subunit beta [Anaerolineae bacterium]
MADRDLRDFLAKLEEAGQLKRITAEVDWNLELSHVAKVNEERNGPALLFENVKGYNSPVFISALSTTERLALALDMPTNWGISQLAREWVNRTQEELPPNWVDTGPCKENIDTGKDVDLYKFPAPWFYEQDGGRYIGTFVSVITKDPDSDWINAGTYRMQMLDKKTTGIQIIKGKDADLHRQRYAELNQPMQIAAVIGYDPVLFLCSSTLFSPGQTEYNYVGALRNLPMEVVRGEYVDLPVPAQAEIVLEGDLWPEKLKDEGPFGEYTGYYSGKGVVPRHYIDVKSVTYRNNPIFHATTVGRPITDTHMIQSMNRTATLWGQLERMGLRGIQSVYIPPASCGRFMVVVSVKQMYPGHSSHVGSAVISTSTGAYGVKVVIVVDDDIPADDMDRVFWALSTRYQPERDSEIIKRGRSTPLDPSLPIDARWITSRIIIDATTPYEWEEKPPVIELSKDAVETVKKRWKEYGFDEELVY